VSIVLEEQRGEFTLEYRRLAEAIPALIWVADATGRTIYANRRWYDFTGVDLAGKDETYVAATLIHPGDRDRMSAAWQAASDGSSPIEIEYRLRMHDGSYHWVFARAIPLRDDAGT
jgi:PAS domain S-box-containing protein